jgi:hypothetical protein
VGKYSVMAVKVWLTLIRLELASVGNLSDVYKRIHFMLLLLRPEMALGLSEDLLIKIFSMKLV